MRRHLGAYCKVIGCVIAFSVIYFHIFPCGDISLPFVPCMMSELHKMGRGGTFSLGRGQSCFTFGSGRPVAPCNFNHMDFCGLHVCTINTACLQFCLLNLQFSRWPTCLVEPCLCALHLSPLAVGISSVLAVHKAVRAFSMLHAKSVDLVITQPTHL